MESYGDRGSVKLLYFALSNWTMNERAWTMD